MATARTVIELRRWADLTVIYGAFEARMPDVTCQKAGLRDVAELCKRDFAARPGRDSTRVRDQLLLIASEWDLNHDRLDKQTNICLGSVASFLR